MNELHFDEFIANNYEIHEWRHAAAILKNDFANEYSELCDVLRRFRLYKSHIAVGGGRKSKVAGWIDGELLNKGWEEKSFETKISVDKKEGFKRHEALGIYI